jgi:hypothetical protein
MVKSAPPTTQAAKIQKAIWSHIVDTGSIVATPPF